MDDVQAARIVGYRRVHDQDAPAPARHPVVIVGAGPVGRVAAIDLAQRGVPTVLLDDADRIGEGSRAVCFAKRSLEVFDRLGVGERMIEQIRTKKHAAALPHNALRHLS
jgi:3-(3-hydroxy-phenyl)propionate hydroxylase